MSRSLRTLYSRTPKILVVDDESFIREAIELYFITEGYKVCTAANGEEALATLKQEYIDVAILDILMPGMSGVTLLREIKKYYPNIEVIMASGNGTLEIAVEAMRLGAYDYIAKPILNFEEDLLRVVRRATERGRLLATNRELARDLQEINFELKSSNSKLRRRVADLELILEIGQLVSEVETRDELMRIVESTFDHHLKIPKALLFVLKSGRWCLSGSHGFHAVSDSAPEIEATDPVLDQIEEGLTKDLPGLLDVLDGIGAAGSPMGKITSIPLRRAGETQGLLLTFRHESESEPERQALLRVFATQISHPLVLLSEGVSN